MGRVRSAAFRGCRGSGLGDKPDSTRVSVALGLEGVGRGTGTDRMLTASTSSLRGRARTMWDTMFPRQLHEGTGRLGPPVGCRA